MYKLNPECWIPSPGFSVCLLPRDPGRFSSDMLMHEEEEDDREEDQEFSIVYHHVLACDDITAQADDAQWSTCNPPVHSGIPTTSVLIGCDHQITAADHVEISQQPFIEGCCCEDLRMESNRCVGVYMQREEDLDPCWAESPLTYCGVMRNVVVGLEVVEEVAVEDTIVILDDVFADGLLDVEVLHEEQFHLT